MKRPLLLGHRGARANRAIPENTIASFDQALADGCDGFEFDVRLTADGDAVICHDPKYRDLKHDDIEIARTPARQLADLPRLHEILSRYCNRAFLDIELKVAGLETLTAGLVHDHPPRRGFVVSSFLPEVLTTLHAADSTVPLGLICDSKAQLGLWERLTTDYLIPHFTLVTDELVQRVKAARKKIFVWTVNSTKEMQRFAALGVNGIISDDTALLCRTIR